MPRLAQARPSADRPLAGRRTRVLAIATACAACLAIGVGLWQLASATADLTVVRARAGTVPVTVFAPVSERKSPVIVIAHGFAGSQQLMQPFAVTLARNGYLAVTFDFPGHGRNPTPLPGGLADYAMRTQALLSALAAVTDFSQELPSSDGRLALIGHSMASDVVVRYADSNPGVQATVAVSLFLSRGISTSSPRNLLVVDGALESRMLLVEGERIVQMSGGATAQPGVTYGSFAVGTARRFALAPGVEHIGVLYSRHSLAEALQWIDQAFGRHGSGFVDARGPWLGLLYLGLVALAWPLSRLLPRVVAVPRGEGCRGRVLVVAAVAPALLTPLILWRIPADFLPILLGDYLVLHFGLYGLLTATCVWMVRRPREEAPRPSVSWGKFAAAALAASAYATLATGLPTNAFVTSLAPTGARLWLIPVMLLGTFPYFVADEWLTRGGAAPRGAYAVTKVCFLLSLMLAIALNLERLFFLVIIVPAMLAFFVVYGLFSAWAYRQTNDPRVGATANAIAFAWAIAATFPIVTR